MTWPTPLNFSVSQTCISVLQVEQANCLMIFSRNWSFGINYTLNQIVCSLTCLPCSLKANESQFWRESWKFIQGITHEGLANFSCSEWLKHSEGPKAVDVKVQTWSKVQAITLLCITLGSSELPPTSPFCVSRVVEWALLHNSQNWAWKQSREEGRLSNLHLLVGSHRGLMQCFSGRSFTHVTAVWRNDDWRT